MGRKKKPGALSAETRELVLMALAQQAVTGNTKAARIYLDEYRQQHAGTDEADYSLLDSNFEEMKGADPNE